MLHGYANPALRERKQFRYRAMAQSSLKELAGVLKAAGEASEALQSFAGNEELPDWIRDNHFNLRRNLSKLLNEYHADVGEVRDEVGKIASEKGEGVSEAWLVALVEAASNVTG